MAGHSRPGKSGPHDRIKKNRLRYDIISGKVNEVSYQQGKGDQFFYKYDYDADNRVIAASTSRDGLIWHNDATYHYYLHGPLARMELGSRKVQGVDYAYTLQGWLKGINGNMTSAYATTGTDMAADGHSTSIYAPFARDVYGISLGYYTGDYAPIGGQDALAFPLTYTPPSSLDNTGNQLFNGNISNSTVTLSSLEGGVPAGYSYGYDQLNRLVHTRWNEFYSGEGGWDNTRIKSSYQEDVSYDGNGNILRYFRNGTSTGHPLAMDSLTYYYNPGTNQLNHIRDNVGANNYYTDIDNQSPGNYGYDSIGNLIRITSDGFTDIGWTVYGKIRKQISASGSGDLVYDANGKLILKEGQSGTLSGKQYYIRDAQGNVLATYNYQASTLTWGEQDLYGTSRIGVWRWNKAIPAHPMLPESETDTLSDWYQVGGRDYELTNHLGNVLSVISDKKIGVSLDDSIVDHYRAEVLSQNDYYPFGMEEPGRGFSIVNGLNVYPYAFNGKRMENIELYTSNIYDYGKRMYDARVGRFFSVDPLTGKYPELSPYQFASNSPIYNIDIDGLEGTGFDQNFDRWITELEEGKITKEQYEKRLDAVGMGGVAGTALVGIGYTLFSIPSASLIARLLFFANTNSELIIGLGGLTASIIDPNPNADYPGGLDEVGKGLRLLIKDKELDKFIINTSKFDFFFGKITSSTNIKRSLQNVRDLATLGIEENREGREKLIKIFEKGLDAPIVGQKSTKYGVSIIRRIELANGDVKGAIDISYFYKGGDRSVTPEITTIIPKIYKK